MTIGISDVACPAAMADELVRLKAPSSMMNWRRRTPSIGRPRRTWCGESHGVLDQQHEAVWPKLKQHYKWLRAIWRNRFARAGLKTGCVGDWQITRRCHTVRPRRL
jgi:hypothetical protein